MAVCGRYQVVRPYFTGLHPHTALLEQAEQAERNGGFATTAAGTRKNERTRLPYPVLFWRSGYSYAHAVLRPRTAKPPTSHRSCWSVTGRQVFWLSLVLARPSQSFDQWFCGVVSITAGGCGGFTPSLTKLVSYLSVCFADAPCIDGYYFMFSFTVSSLVTMTSVKESGVVIISCLVLTDTLSHHKIKLV